MRNIKKEFVGTLGDVSKLVEYIIESDEVEKKVNDEEFSRLAHNVSYYKIDEIIDYLEALIELEEKNDSYY